MLDPYHQNVLKGDYPILGQHNFLNITATEDLLLEARQVPTPTTPFESTPDPNSEEFFGDPDQFFLLNNIVLSFDLDSRRRRVQAGRLAGQDHADLQRQPPRRR